MEIAIAICLRVLPLLLYHIRNRQIAANIGVEQDKLKSLPRDYDADNEHIELLKLKSFVAWHQFKDAEILKADIAKKITEICSRIYPLNVFLRNAIV